MHNKEFQVRFTLADVVRIILSPYFIVPAVVLVLVVPWGGEHAPAWVQAIGSLVGIAVAVAVPASQWRLSAREKKEDAMRSDYQAALMGLKACIEVDEFLNDLIKRSSGNRNEWHDKEHFRNTIAALQQRLASLAAVERNSNWWNLFLDAKSFLMELDSALRLNAVDAGVVRVLAETRKRDWEDQLVKAREGLDEIEEKHKAVLYKDIWEDVQSSDS